jgi:FKBP-type peptidyl-prolyl cis-trans isomerase FklB
MNVKQLVILTMVSMGALASCNLQKAMNKDVSLKSEIDTVSYSLGVSIGQSIKSQGMDTINTEVFMQAIQDVFNKDSLKVSPMQANQLLSSYFQNLQVKKSQNNLKEGQDFLAKNKSKEGVKTLPSGLQYKVLKEGSGASPKATDTVVAHYTGKLLNGTKFDSSLDRGQPLVYPANQLIPGWTEALQLMKVGSKWELYIPSELAYGERGAGQDIGPNSTLIFEMELLGIGDPGKAAAATK